ncbi:folate family ECF transporter S component [Anaerobranca gottschalkii]|uniref:ECF transporter S component, folate family n=1 Tax=Anaerobranca gottschalkii DSM 13577 TaxID=1120990 RepID=A0A1I0AJZ5_9FIRM|nr:folate family ECF transporter S component [Anaerobranca gottschalkii]SES94667.1 ECF transporter S component, folate family [Anaerobranca gottschalkii DSM 13577]
MEIFNWFVETLSTNFYFQVVVFATIFALFSYISKGKTPSTTMNKTYCLTLASLLIALSIVLTRFASAVIPLGGLPALRIGLGPIPIIIASLVLGPHWGFAVGAVADVVGVTLFPQGSPIFLIFVAQGLYGVLPHYFKLLFKGNSFINFLFTVSLTQLITGFITTIGLAHAFGWPLWEAYFLRLPTQLTLMILYSITVFLLNKIVQPVVAHRIVTHRR